MTGFASRSLPAVPGRRSVSGLLALVLAAGLLAACSRDGDGARSSKAPAGAAGPATTLATPRGLPDFASLVEQVGPAVVNISTAGRDEEGEGSGAIDPQDPLYEFFRRFNIPLPDAEKPPAEGVGSGFIISADGYILTNAHVVAGASEVTVKLTDKRDFKARVVGTDKRTDVALIKIDADKLPTVKVGNPAATRVGEWVAAIGSPFGFENSVTAGIVSAKARQLPDENYVPFLQTDVAINPGNSGGPLFNMAGEVIGINSQIYSQTGGYMGLSFAIPIDVAMQVKDQLQQHGRVSRGRLGVTIQPVTRELAESFGLAKAEGALVTSVERGGPADKAGLQSGDVIQAVAGQRVESSADLPRMIGELGPGKKVVVDIWRAGQKKSVEAVLAEFDDPRPVRATPRQSAREERLGLALRVLTDADRRKLETEGSLVVEAVDGPASRAGVRPGDVILAVNNERVGSLEELRRLTDKAGKRVALLIQRDENRLYLALKLD